MPVSLEALGIDKLSVAERLELMQQIWDSLPEDVDSAEVPDWHLAELSKRRTQADLQTGQGSPWREVLDRLESGT